MDVGGDDEVGAALAGPVTGELEDEVARPVFRLLARDAERPARVGRRACPLGGDRADARIGEERLQDHVGLDREVALRPARPLRSEHRRGIGRIDHGREARPLRHPLDDGDRLGRGGGVDPLPLLGEKGDGCGEPFVPGLAARHAADRLGSHRIVVVPPGLLDCQRQRPGPREHPLAVDEIERLQGRGRRIAAGAAGVGVGPVERVAQIVAGVADHGGVDRPPRLRRRRARAGGPWVEVAGDRQRRVAHLLRVEPPRVLPPEELVLRIDRRPR